MDDIPFNTNAGVSQSNLQWTKQLNVRIKESKREDKDRAITDKLSDITCEFWQIYLSFPTWSDVLGFNQLFIQFMVYGYFAGWV